MDIQQAMALLQNAQQGGGMGGMGAVLNPYGALQPGNPVEAQAMPAPALPDYNAILQQKLIAQQADQARQGMLGASGGIPPHAMAGQMQDQFAQMMAERLGARTGGAMQFDPSMGMQGMHQQFRDWRQAGNQPVGFGQANRGLSGVMGNPGAPPVGTAVLPGASAAAPLQSGLGADYMKQQRGRLGGPGGGERYNPDVNQF